MSCAMLIRKHIELLQPGEIFTTRDFVDYGTRTAIDQYLWKLVNIKEINRLTNGVFVDSYKRRATYSSTEIAQAKTQAFAKNKFDHDSKSAEQLSLPVDDAANHVYAVNRSTTSMRQWEIGGRLYLRGASGRKERLANQKCGDIIRALWQIGKKRCQLEHVKKVTAQWDHEQVKNLLANGRWMPNWLLELFREASGNYWLKVAFRSLEARASLCRSKRPDDTSY